MEKPMLRIRPKKKAVPEGTAKFREETSKKSSGRHGLVAAFIKLGAVTGCRKQFFAAQHKSRSQSTNASSLRGTAVALSHPCACARPNPELVMPAPRSAGS
jgi:hypothetical protein